MPTISEFAVASNQLPEAPPATDIAPERFGKDAAELARLGGQIGDFGSKLMETRKRAIESDAVASAYSDSFVQFGKFEEEEKAAYQESLRSNPNQPADIAGVSDRVKTRMDALIQERLKAMPTGDAQQSYMERIQPLSDRMYVGTRAWENSIRSNFAEQKNEVRIDGYSQEIYRSASLSKALDAMAAIKMDLSSQDGTVIGAEQSSKIQSGAARKFSASLFEGLAEEISTTKDEGIYQERLAYGKKLVGELPKELSQHLDAADLRKLDSRLDQAARERKTQIQIDKSAQKEAMKVAQDKAQNAILSDIYSGKSNVKDIIHGKGAILDPDKKQIMLNILKARQNEPKVANPEGLRKVVERIYAEPDDPRRITSEREIMQSYVKGELTWDQKQKALNEFRGRFTAAGQVETDMKKQLFKQASAALTQKDALGMADPAGQEQLAKFQSFALNEIEQARKEGKPIRELLDANSPKYLGNLIKNYQRSPQQIFKEQAARLKNQAVQKQTQSQVVPQPKGTVLMLDPSGKRFYVPEANAAKARARGFKPVDNKGRRPQSIGEPKFFNPSTGEAFAEPEEKFGLSFDEESIERVLRDPNLSKEEKLDRLSEFQSEMEDFDPSASDSDVPPEKFQSLMERVKSASDGLDETIVLKKRDTPRGSSKEKTPDDLEERLAASPRGRTDADEAAIRGRLNDVRSYNRNAGVDKRKK